MTNCRYRLSHIFSIHIIQTYIIQKLDIKLSLRKDLDNLFYYMFITYFVLIIY